MKRMRFIHGVFAMMLIFAGNSCFARGAGDFGLDNITVTGGLVSGLVAPYVIAGLSVNADKSRNIVAVGPNGEAVKIEFDSIGTFRSKTPAKGFNSIKSDYAHMLERRNDVDLAWKQGVSIKYDPTSSSYKRQREIVTEQISIPK